MTSVICFHVEYEPGTMGDFPLTDRVDHWIFLPFPTVWTHFWTVRSEVNYESPTGPQPLIQNAVWYVCFRLPSEDRAGWRLARLSQTSFHPKPLWWILQHPPDRVGFFSQWLYGHVFREPESAERLSGICKWSFYVTQQRKLNNWDFKVYSLNNMLDKMSQLEWLV